MSGCSIVHGETLACPDLSLTCPEFASQTLHHMWVEFEFQLH